MTFRSRAVWMLLFFIGIQSAVAASKASNATDAEQRLSSVPVLSSSAMVDTSISYDAALKPKSEIKLDLFAQPLSFHGTLGSATIDMHLQLKPDPTEGLQGFYSGPDQSSNVLLAGEHDAGEIIMEESINGKDVSGDWAGQFDGKTFIGTWSSIDDTVTMPFVLVVQSDKIGRQTISK